MIINKESFDQLVNEAWSEAFSGWDFAFVKGRMIETPPSWNYRQIVLEKLKEAQSLVDMDTGGGEFLSTLQPFPALTCATEGYSPNVPVARERLEHLGVRVLDMPDHEKMPFDDALFDLVINRHGGYRVSELDRILKHGGSFITQQVGGRNCIRLNEMLQDEVEFEYSYWTLDYALQQFDESGLRVVDGREEYPLITFTDIGAVVFYLKVVSWQVSGFTPEKYYKRLGEIHNIIQETGKFEISEHRFFIEAKKD